MERDVYLFPQPNVIDCLHDVTLTQTAFGCDPHRILHALPSGFQRGSILGFKVDTFRRVKDFDRL